jgi:hypothetical protein
MRYHLGIVLIFVFKMEPSQFYCKCEFYTKVLKISLLQKYPKAQSVGRCAKILGILLAHYRIELTMEFQSTISQLSVSRGSTKFYEQISDQRDSLKNFAGGHKIVGQSWFLVTFDLKF